MGSPSCGGWQDLLGSRLRLGFDQGTWPASLVSLAMHMLDAADTTSVDMTLDWLPQFSC